VKKKKKRGRVGPIVNDSGNQVLGGAQAETPVRKGERRLRGQKTVRGERTSQNLMTHESAYITKETR